METHLLPGWLQVDADGSGMIASQRQSSAKGRPLLRPVRREEARVILSEETFRHTLGRERLLADRHHRHFSLAVFRLPAGSLRLATDPQVVGILAQRARLTDDVGWLRRSGIGVLLRETGAEGARQFCGCVVGALAEIGANVTWRVIRYPQNSSPAEYMGARSTEWSARSGSPADRRLPAAREAVEPPHQPAGPAEDIPRLVARPLPAWKRMLDVTGALTGLVLCAPVIGVAAVLIKLASPGPVLFRQERVGHLGRRFTCWKLRTMHVGADTVSHRDYVQGLVCSAAAMTKLDSGRDARVFAVGRYLRATALDELPQLFNVLRGDMSLIGPRPCIPYEYEQYQAWHRQRCEAVPGLTGLWQVSGKNRLSFAQMVRLDIAYARRHTLALDLNILLKTVPAVWAEARGNAGAA